MNMPLVKIINTPKHVFRFSSYLSRAETSKKQKKIFRLNARDLNCQIIKLIILKGKFDKKIIKQDIVEIKLL